MITTEGKNYIKRYLAGWVPSIAQSVAFGIGINAEAVTDKALQLEVVRAPVTFMNYDFANNKLIFKASIPTEFIGKIYEMGLWSVQNDPGEAPSRFITSFDSATENWINVSDGLSAAFNTANARVGADALRHTPVANATQTASLANVKLDLSGFSAADSFSFAYNVADANTNQIVFRFLTDASNYYSFSMGAQTAGYKIATATKGSATVTGTPNWASINEIQILTTAKSTGATTVDFDVIRLEDKDTFTLDYVLVSRKVLATPITSVDGQPMDVEYSLDISIT